MECRVDDEVRQLHIDVQVRERHGLTNSKKEWYQHCRAELLENKAIICGTLSAIQKEKYDSNASVLEEAAQVTEPASLGLINPGTRQLLLIGDPNQLPPTVGPTASFSGLQTSLLERLWRKGFRYSMLTEQYRMAKSIMSAPSGLFHDNALTCSNSFVANPPKMAGIQWPDDSHTLFVNVHGYEESVGTSRRNRYEVE